MYDFWNSMLLVIRRWHDYKNRKYAFPLQTNPYLTTIPSKIKKKSHPVTTCLPYYLFIIRWQRATQPSTLARNCLYKTDETEQTRKKKKKTFRGESMPIKVELIPTVVHFFSSRFSHSTCPHHTLRKQRREGRELTKKKNSNPAYNFPLCCFVCVCLISSCVPVAVRVCVWPQPSLNPKFALFECRCH